MINPADRRKSGLTSRQRSMHPKNFSKNDKTPRVTCRQAVDFIARYLSADLQGRELAAYESHLAACRDCIAFLKTYKTTIDLTRTFLATQAQENGKLAFSLKPPAKPPRRR